MRRAMAVLVVAGSVGLTGCTAATYGGSTGYAGGYGYDYGYPGPAYAAPPVGYYSPGYTGGALYLGGHDRGEGWYRGDDGEWRRHEWQNNAANAQPSQQQQQYHQQVQQNRALYEQQVQQNQATYQRQVQENAAKYQQQVQQNQALYNQNLAKYNQQVQENRAIYARQQMEAQKKMLGQ